MYSLVQRLLLLKQRLYFKFVVKTVCTVIRLQVVKFNKVKCLLLFRCVVFFFKVKFDVGKSKFKFVCSLVICYAISWRDTH